MLYNPKHFDEKRTELIHELIARYNFATLVVLGDQTPVVSHLPLLFDASKGQHGALTGHMARANPQWRSLKQNDVLVIFHGPHAYVSPRWYVPQPDNVPTWNYAVVHVHGATRIMTDAEESYAAMHKLVAAHDPSWTLALNDKDRDAMLREIVVFEIAITKIEAKFKLSQNRSVEDSENVMAELLKSSCQVERDTAKLMKKYL